jgi:hypothetical protein
VPAAAGTCGSRFSVAISSSSVHVVSCSLFVHPEIA